MKKRLAIIGNGMAAGRLLDELMRRGASQTYDITVFGEELHGCYNRILLGRVLTGADAAEITLKPMDWYPTQGVELKAGIRVERIDTMSRQVATSSGERFPYDVVVFATGSIPLVPPCEGVKGANGKPKPGVFAFRTVDDCAKMRDFAQPASSAVVVGGGLLGLEAAKALCDLGLHVTVLHLLDTLMNAQLDRLGGQMLRRAVEKMGIFVRVSTTAAEVLGSERAEGVRLTSGEVLPADLIVFACGILPRVDAAKASGVPVKRGIVVNDRLATSIPGVYAVGECAEHDGKVYGLVEPIWEQCNVLADVLTGANPKSRYGGSRTYARLKVVGVEVASMGLVEAERDSDEVVQVIEDRKGIYRKLVIREGKLAGAMLVGCTEAAPSLVQIFDRNEPLPPNRLDVLASPGGGLADGSNREICNCCHVTESTLVEAIRDGATTLPTLSARTRAGTGCGSCRGQLAGLLLQHAGKTEAGRNGIH